MVELYVIRAINGLYKIGIAAHVHSRFLLLRMASPVDLELLFCIQTDDAKSLERELHRHFDSKRHHGEWFDLSDEDIEYIRNRHCHAISDNHRAVKSFKGVYGAVYSTLCPECGRWSRPRNLKDCLLLKCQYCNTETSFPYPGARS